MERVETLLQKLQQQFKDGKTATQLLTTVQMLQHELVHLVNSDPQANGMIAVSMPLHIIPAMEIIVSPEHVIPAAPEKIVEVLKVNEDEIAAELEELKRNATARQQLITANKPTLLFDITDDEIPTLAQHQFVKVKEINETANREAASLNERLKEEKIEISEKLNDVPVKDLKKAIGINDRFLYINDLFRGDEDMYERSIKTINSFSIMPEAEYWIRRELKTKLGWTDDNNVVKQFDQLVRRRFS